MALLMVSARGIPIKVINIKSLSVREILIRKMRGNKTMVIISSILKEVSV
jgi:hypothetical protein